MASHLPKKYLGQHFLKEPEIARRIAESLGEEVSKAPYTVAEIGPGQGVMTRFLLDIYGSRLHAIEIDDDLIPLLRQKFPELAPRLHHVDFLEFDIRAQFPEGLAIIGNFPYNISSQIMFRVIEARDLVPVAAGMFQREVARRLCAQPSTKEYGLLSAWLQCFYTCEYLFTVSEGCFNPPPKVKSGVIRLARRADWQEVENAALLFRVIKTAFGQRRKTLRNSLAPFMPQLAKYDPAVLALRAENLSPAMFMELTNAIAKESTGAQSAK